MRDPFNIKTKTRRESISVWLWPLMVSSSLGGRWMIIDDYVYDDHDYEYKRLWLWLWMIMNINDYEYDDHDYEYKWL